MTREEKTPARPPLPAELRAQIGSELRAARVRLGQSLEDAARRTRVPKRYLEALESDRFGEFEALVYLRGFLQSYCEQLGVSFEPLWKRLVEPPSAPAAPAPAPERPQARTPAALAASALLAAALPAALLWRGRPDAPDAPAPGPAALQRLPQAADVRLGLSAAEDAWVRVETDGRLQFEGILPRGAALEWSPKRGLRLLTPNPDALRLTMNGKRRGLPAAGPDGARRVEVLE